MDSTPSITDSLLPGTDLSTLGDVNMTTPTVGPVPDSSNPVGSAISDIVNAPTAILNFIDAIGPAIKALSSYITPDHLVQLGLAINPILEYNQFAIDFITKHKSGLWAFMSDNVAGTLFKDLLEAGLGLDTGKFDDDAQKGVKTVDTMIGFAMSMELAGIALNLIGKLPFANRFSESLGELIAKTTEEMGLSWAMGTIIEESFQTAVGRSIEEGINQQKHGNRLEWQQLKQLIKTHQLSVKDALVWFDKLGYLPEQAELLANMVTAELTVGDLQQMYLHNIIDQKQFAKELETLGYGPENIARLVSLYADKAETAAGALYASVARGLAEESLISDSMYSDILAKINYPEMEIADNLAAIQLIKDHGKVRQSVSVIKSRYQHHAIDGKEATTELKALNYDDVSITNMLQTWDELPLSRPQRMSLAKVLSFYASGILSPKDTMERMSSLGVNQTDQTFYLAHPTARNGVTVHKLSPGMVTQAYVDGLITAGQLPDKFKAAGVADADIDMYEQIALYKEGHKKGNPGFTATLTEGNILRAFHLGIFDVTTALERLHSIGFDDADAMVLLEIENKGAPLVNVGATPMTLAQALGTLEELGFTIYGQPNPTVSQAEQVVSSAGYSFTPPPDFNNSGPVIYDPNGPGTAQP